MPYLQINSGVSIDMTSISLKYVWEPVTIIFSRIFFRNYLAVEIKKVALQNPDPVAPIKIRIESYICYQKE